MANPFEHGIFTVHLSGSKLPFSVIVNKINFIFITVPLKYKSAKFGDVLHTNTTNPTSIVLDPN